MCGASQTTYERIVDDARSSGQHSTVGRGRHTAEPAAQADAQLQATPSSCGHARTTLARGGCIARAGQRVRPRACDRVEPAADSADTKRRRVRTERIEVEIENHESDPRGSRVGGQTVRTGPLKSLEKPGRDLGRWL